LILTLAAILNRCHSLSTLEDEVGAFLIRLWKLLEATVHVTPKDLSASQSRPELLVEAVITCVAALAQCSLSGNPHQDLRQSSVPSSYIDGCLRSFSLCLTHESATDVEILPFAARHLLQVIDEKCKAETMQFWITVSRLIRRQYTDAKTSSRLSTLRELQAPLASCWRLEHHGVL